MQKTHHPQEMAQVRMALEHGQKVAPFRGVVYIFWGLIVAKCTMAEWAIQYYDMPIRSYYIWGPMIIFAAVCTWVYAGANLRETTHRPLTGRFVRAVWGGCIMAMTLIGIVGAGAGVFNPYLVPALFSIIMGVGYFIHSVVDHRFVYKFAAYGWWIGSIGLLIQPNLNALAWFSLMIVLFQVLPATWLYLQYRRELKV